LNLPAQSLYDSLPTLYNLCDASKINAIIWYCGKLPPIDWERGTIFSLSGSSRGRGTRAAGWFEDLIKEKGHESMKSLVLLEGIAGWATAGTEYANMIDGFDKEFWDKR
jgi:arsenical-resistance protein 2